MAVQPVHVSGPAINVHIAFKPSYATSRLCCVLDNETKAFGDIFQASLFV